MFPLLKSPLYENAEGIFFAPHSDWWGVGKEMQDWKEGKKRIRAVRLIKPVNIPMGGNCKLTPDRIKRNQNRIGPPFDGRPYYLRAEAGIEKTRLLMGGLITCEPKPEPEEIPAGGETPGTGSAWKKLGRRMNRKGACSGK